MNEFIKNSVDAFWGFVTNLPLILLFLLILTLIVCIHEFGHFITAKKFGVNVQEFSIGMGKLIWKKDWHGTQYSIRLFPIGGYVKMLGEGEVSNEKGSFSLLKPWKRLIIIYAGVVMNFATVVVVFTIFALKSGGDFFAPQIDQYRFPIGDTGKSKIVISSVIKNSPAEKAGLASYEIINKINSNDYNNYDEFKSILDQNINKEIEIELVSSLSSEKRTLKITPGEYQSIINKDNKTVEETRQGLGINLGGLYTKSSFTGPSIALAGFAQSYNYSDFSVKALVYLIQLSISRNDPSIAANSVVGPIGSFAITKRVTDVAGFWAFVYIAALLSLAIGLMNALPFPALDGWHGIFIIFEIFTGKKVPEAFYNTVTLVGFVILLGLGALIAVKDVLNFKTLLGQ